MRKEAEMIKQKKEQVEKRRKIVRKACEECIEEGVTITYKKIADRVDISHKTLERSPYKDDINYFKNINKKDDFQNKEISLLRDQVKYLRQVIVQLNKENHELKTELYNNGII